MSGELSLGLASGFRQRRDQQKAELVQADERKRQNDRQDVADARVAEASTYEKGQRPAREKLQKLQTDNATRAGEAQQRTLDDAKKAASEEGFYDFMDQLERGVDANTALNAYNARGSHKIDPRTFSYDRARGHVKFVDDDGSPFEGDVKQIKGVLADSLTPSTQKRQLTKVGDHEIVIDGTGKEVARGALYGKDKDAPIISGKKAGEWYRDTDRKWKQVPGKVGGGKAGGLPGGSKEGTWTLQNAQKSVREIIAAKLGLKYDSQLEQMVGGKPGATDAWLELSAQADDVLNRVKDTMGPAQIAHMVTDAYSGVQPLSEYQKEAQKNTQRMRENDPNKPDSFYTSAEPEAQWQARVQTNAKAAREAAMKQAQGQLETNLMPFIPAADDGTGATGYDEGSADTGGEVDENGDPINPDDLLPAVDGGAAAGAAPAAAAPSGPRAHYPVTVDRVVADADVQTQGALKALKSAPQIMGLLTATAEPGKANVVKFPDGNLYYLAGTQLKRLNMKPPAKGK